MGRQLPHASRPPRSAIVAILMTDVLKDEGDFWQLDFRTQEVIVIVPELSICEVIPSMIVLLLSDLAGGKWVHTC